MKIKSYSKINLSLKVTKKLKKKKLHQIQSLYCLIDHHDEIQVSKSNCKKDNIKFYGKFANLVDKKNNSIKTLLMILREKKIISNYYSVLIKKNIPVFAGMGGANSNAIHLLKYLTKEKYTKIRKLIDINKIGSDSILFYQKFGFLKNLNQVVKLKKNFKLYFLLVYPNLRCRTQQIYASLRKLSKKNSFNHRFLKNKKNFIEFLSIQNNDLQTVVEKKYPIIKKIIVNIQKKRGCYFSRITGSGSVCYGLFKSAKTAKAALNSLKSKYPKYWLTTSKTI